MKRPLLSLFFVLALPLLPALSSARDEILYDGFENFSRMEEKVRDVVELNRTPLFDNAPFLRLRPGDKLVKAKEVAEWRKSKGEPSDKVWVYLFSKGKYYRLWTDEENGKLLLSPPFCAGDSSLLFDWDATPANADALRQILPRQYTESLTREQYRAVLWAVRKNFPEIKIDPEGEHPSLKPDRMISIPNQVLFEFDGLLYDAFGTNCLYKYTVKIGPAVFSIVARPLLQGPRHVEREEFEGYKPSGKPNEGGFFEVDPATAKVKKAEYDRMIQFQEVVKAAIDSKSH